MVGVFFTDLHILRAPCLHTKMWLFAHLRAKCLHKCGCLHFHGSTRCYHVIRLVTLVELNHEQTVTLWMHDHSQTCWIRPIQHSIKVRSNLRRKVACVIFTNKWGCCHIMTSSGPISLAWRLGGDLVATRVSATSPRSLLETSRVSGESREIQTCSIFWRLFFQSPAGLGDVSATSPSVAPRRRED